MKDRCYGKSGFSPQAFDGQKDHAAMLCESSGVASGDELVRAVDAIAIRSYID
jgi:hypothetical protein